MILLQVPPTEASVKDDRIGENRIPETENESEPSVERSQFDAQFKFLHNPWFSTRDQETGDFLRKNFKLNPQTICQLNHLFVILIQNNVAVTWSK